MARDSQTSLPPYKCVSWDTPLPPPPPLNSWETRHLVCVLNLLCRAPLHQTHPTQTERKTRETASTLSDLTKQQPLKATKTHYVQQKIAQI